jgi:hypothetical protein
MVPVVKVDVAMLVQPEMAISPALLLTVVAELPKNLIPKDSAWTTQPTPASATQKSRQASLEGPVRIFANKEFLSV